MKAIIRNTCLKASIHAKRSSIAVMGSICAKGFRDDFRNVNASHLCSIHTHWDSNKSDFDYHSVQISVCVSKYCLTI